MSNFREISKQFYIDNEHEKLDRNKLIEIRDKLKTVESQELVSVEDHQEYLNLLNKFRTAIAETTALNGENFNKTIASLLAVGADGLYSSDLRFLFELIQNVDDCNYAEDSERELNVHFDFNKGEIVLEYNETGFRPFDVFSITGIAEKAKNISPEKIEIGEKGIGFKSVFGVADRVLVQSGKFSFMLDKENFTIPELCYDNFDSVKGTKLTLFLSAQGKNEATLAQNRGQICRQLFNKLVDAYSAKDSLFKINPILFLNKLTRIRLYNDGFDSLEFTVSKALNKKILLSGVVREEDVTISSLVSARKKNIEKRLNEIVCTRYIVPVEYDHEMCVSRYGEDTAFSSKKMTLQLIVPNTEFVNDVGDGSLYSFLPTQIKTSVPISCHIPFKLDSSREYVDDQNENKWFLHSRNEFAKMLKIVYVDLAERVRTDILDYLPILKNYFFSCDNNNNKTRSLRNECFSAMRFLELPVFYTAENDYKSYNEIFCFSPTERIEDPLAVYSLMKQEKKLFIPSQKNCYKAGLYGIKIIKDVHLMLFEKALKEPKIFKSVMDIIDTTAIKYSTLVEDLDAKYEEMKIPYDTVVEISKYPSCLRAFNFLAINKIREQKKLLFKVENVPFYDNLTYIVSKDEPLDVSVLDVTVDKYLKSQKYLYAKGDFGKGASYFVGENALILSEYDTLKSFAVFARDLGKNDYFAANLTMRAASLKLNSVDDALSAQEYMKLLHDVRESIKSAFGKRQYESYVKVIRELSSDPKRFIRELLQNADDCKYEEGETPCFKLTIGDGILKTECNEKGFTKENARAITSIGESTKKQIYSEKLEIGEKGIGFKTVFAVADEVEIHSNEFHFSLAYSTPTIPKILSYDDSYDKGTTMIFKLRNNAKLSFSKEEILSLCLCLRNLKDIDISDVHINIEDVNGQRIVRVNNEQYIFDVYTHIFKITNPLTIKERSNGDKFIAENQKISYLVSQKNIPKMKYYLYEGLPTSIEIGVPLVINAPFELTASRDDVLQNRWNSTILAELYKGYIRLLEAFVPKYRIKIMRYLHFRPIQFGSQIKFELFKNDWLNDYDVLSQLRLGRIIPTYDKDYFTMPKDMDVCRYPTVVHNILSLVGDVSDPKHIIDDRDNNFDSVLKNLGCKEVSFTDVVGVICKYDAMIVKDEKLLKSLYEYLEKSVKSGANNTNLRNAKIIPVKGSLALPQTQFVSYNDYKDKIFVDHSATFSPVDYKVLDMSVLSKLALENILEVDIKTMDSVYKKSLYDKKIEEIIISHKPDQQKYSELMRELTNNQEMLKASIGVLFQYKYKIPFKMETGEYVTGKVFTVKSEHRYFNSKILNSCIVSQEATQLAKLVEMPEIYNISYEDLDIHEKLDEDDIIDFLLPYIRDGYRILRECMTDGFISDELIEKCGLSGIKTSDYSEYFDESDFPNEPVRNLSLTRTTIIESVKNARKIIKVRVESTVDRVLLPNGKEVSIDSKEIREKTMRRYRPGSNTDGCFCQMCRTVKSTEYIETNNIFLKPEYYWPQTRISLCFDCSKKFKMMRENDDIMEKFYRGIEMADTTSDEAVSIPIGDVDIRFTQMHLVELQEIIKSNKK